MESNLVFSFEVRLVIARLARLLRKYDHLRTGLSNEEDIMHLLEVASVHPRPEVQSIYEELCYLMSDDELRQLEDQGHTLPEEYARRLPGNVNKPKQDAKPKLMYRGQEVKR